MSQSTHRQRRNEKTFEDLPPRVVIYDILNCIEITLDSSIDEFDLFGYYKRDRRRSVWFLFQSLDFSSVFDDDIQDDSTFPVVKMEKLQSLQWSDKFKTKKVFKRFLETFKRTNMYLLKRLTIFHLFSESLCGLFSSQNRFPKLSHLKIVADKVTEDWEWDVDRIKSLQETLTSLDVHIEMHHPLPDLNFLANNVTFSSLKKVYFRSILFSNQRTIQLPQLEEVRLDFCRNLVLSPGSNVTSVMLSGIQSTDYRKLFLRSKRIKHLELCEYELFNDSNNWFYEESTNPMKYLHSLQLNSYNERYENLEIFLERIKHQLTKFEVRWCPSLQEDLLENGFEKLEVLKISDTQQLLQNETKWECARHLKILTISEIRYGTFLRSILFKTNHFPSLEILDLGPCFYADITSLYSESFSPLKNLKELRLRRSYIGDMFFAEQDFENLEVMKIVDLQRKPLTGKNWKRTKFNKLKEITIYGEGVSNDLFKLIEFPGLRKLELLWCGRISGEGWLSMPNLCDVCIVKCPAFSNVKILKKQKKRVE